MSPPKPEKRKIAPPLTPEHPWERQPGETDSAWQGFVAYRDMGAGERSTSKLAVKYRKQRKNFTVWSSKYDWVARCASYDSFLDGKKREAAEAAILDMQRRHIDISMALQGAGALALNKIIAAERALKRDGKGNVVLAADGKPELADVTLKPSEARDLIELGVKLERLNRGEPESIAEQRHSVTAGEKREDLRSAGAESVGRKIRDLLDGALAEEAGDGDADSVH